MVSWTWIWTRSALGFWLKGLERRKKTQKFRAPPALRLGGWHRAKFIRRQCLQDTLLLKFIHRAQNYSILLVCVWGHVLFLSSEQFESFYPSRFYNSQKIKFDMKFQFKNRFWRWRNGKFWQNCRQTATSFFDPGSAGISSPSQVLLSPP